MKVTLVMMVASSDMPTAQPGTERLARKYSSVVRLTAGEAQADADEHSHVNDDEYDVRGAHG